MQDKLDFSGLERLTPKADSWEKVCSRIDAESRSSRFRILSALPLAASFALVGFSILMTAFSTSSESIAIGNVTSADVASWYDSLGNNDSDDFDTLDENVTLSYFYKETR